MYYFNARWYDAGTGRFISEDPTRDGANWFIYTSNNPVSFIDPTGLYKVWGQLKDYGMTYGIRTQSRAERLLNTASNAIVGAGIPYVGAGLVQRFRATLDKIDGMTGFSRFSIYKDTDVPNLDGMGSVIDVGEKLSGPLKGIAGNGTNFIGAFGAVNQGYDDIKGLIEDIRIDEFTSGLNRGIFEDIDNPKEAVGRAEWFVAGVNAFYDNDLTDSGISFDDWQSALVDVSNGVDNELFNDNMSFLEGVGE